MVREAYDYIVVGCGVFGLSTARELAQRFPDKSVLCLDAFEVPSKWSAANDYNKIIRAEYSDITYSKLALEAIEQWETDPVLKPHFVKSGRLTLSPVDSANSHRLKYENQGVANLVKLGIAPGKISVIKDLESLAKVAPEFSQSTLFDAIPNPVELKYNPDAGFGIARDSLVAVYKAALASGVKFVFGPQGKVVRLDSKTNTVVAESGDSFTASKLVIAMGASTGYLVNLENQINSTGLFVTHVQCTEEEFNRYKDMPIFFSAEYGYFFPPDPTTKKLKVAMTFCDSKNTVYNELTKETSSLPRYKTDFPNDSFPAARGQAAVKKLLELTLPELSNHSLVESKVCWISDTVDSNFLIDYVPGSQDIVVACGDSGHGYKFLGNIGKYIVDKLDMKLDPEMDKKWEWRSNPAWPTDMKSRAKRDHLEMKSIKDWYIESHL